MNIHEVLKDKAGAYLFGSRSKGFETEESDWDYAVDASFNTKEILEGLGFVHTLLPEEYKDIISKSLYLHPDYPEIQVISKTLFSVFKKVWEDIPPEEFEIHLYKKGPILGLIDEPLQKKGMICNYIDMRIISSLAKNQYFNSPLTLDKGNLYDDEGIL
jgi:predicted nucleotidyltransferase